LPLAGTRRERAQYRSRKSLNLTHCLDPRWSKSILANSHAIPKLGFGPGISTSFPQAPALGTYFRKALLRWVLGFPGLASLHLRECVRVAKYSAACRKALSNSDLSPKSVTSR
jgi:hypothetical protein